MKQFKGKAIYTPRGKAGEYAQWACNFYAGCSNGCSYCYCKKGIFSNAMGQEKAQLKTCFRSETDAMIRFHNEMMRHKEELQRYGLFFSFSTDPMLSETVDLTFNAIGLCVSNQIPVKILTKKTDYLHNLYNTEACVSFLKDYIAIGLTLTGCDELEPGASSNEDRIATMKKLHEVGFKTWASIEPVIDIDRSFEMIRRTIGFCDLYKVGLQTGKKYDWRELRGLILACTPMNSKFYFKDSFIGQARLDRNSLPENCVTGDYNLFKI